jgi:hypothetical protein
VCRSVCVSAVGANTNGHGPLKGIIHWPCPYCSTVTVLYCCTLARALQTALCSGSEGYSWTGGRKCTTPPHALLDIGSRIPPAGCVAAPHSKSNQDATNYCQVYFYSHFSSCCLGQNSINPEFIKRTAQNTCSSIQRYSQPLLAHTYNANHTTYT